ncbi:MAG TPA: hypothetical protein PKY82_16095 [Pyrinomonadaceae bacterium]|nr:hypothetical protein [Pyrinomonadaceae bacterium]
MSDTPYFNKFVTCPECRGKGTIHCLPCGGTGYIEKVRHTSCNQGQRQCPSCGGSRKILSFDTVQPPKPPPIIKHLPSKEENRAIYCAKSSEASQKRDFILQWLLRVDSLPMEYQMKTADWLSGISLDQPKISEVIEEVARQWYQPDLSKECRELGMLLWELSSLCFAMENYKKLSE